MGDVSDVERTELSLDISAMKEMNPHLYQTNTGINTIILINYFASMLLNTAADSPTYYIGPISQTSIIASFCLIAIANSFFI